MYCFSPATTTAMTSGMGAAGSVAASRFPNASFPPVSCPPPPRPPNPSGTKRGAGSPRPGLSSPPSKQLASSTTRRLAPDPDPYKDPVWGGGVHGQERNSARPQDGEPWCTRWWWGGASRPQNAGGGIRWGGDQMGGRVPQSLPPVRPLRWARKALPPTPGCVFTKENFIRVGSDCRLVAAYAEVDPLRYPGESRPGRTRTPAGDSAPKQTGEWGGFP